ncbi:leucyl/phenylalanyl-tRNA--protein transferase [Aequorivita antarctica]|uniref:Leucyl/phenylalanyl-tRNA--protein transferase n=1 Tax=Aequorivita antarctica TaxID=153266 RepID=A0A5C6Z1U5_9FLAO|nr:leucyl/phenylalanyl-tRNA--protein transferase [Aequorivita antarctica]TXD73976.1 leucyl/phenylalanyl-tRNA--protein transferase [Aequorivita antarctica]SRX73304.1 Leucyl/phenylalanyl-tRNA--protein transferase [Aequorivita antarctica]
MHYLTEQFWFPSSSEATVDGLLAIGGDLSVERLVLAYKSGIFPWFEDDQPILWWSPNPRMVLFPEKFKVSKSLRKTLNSKKFKITFNQNFAEVLKKCATVPRKGQAGTWITEEMQESYITLHESGHAVSIEVWENDKLVGGLYGVDVPQKKVFCGESMFSLVSDASKVAFYHLSEYLKTKNYKFIDCQIYNEHLESLGAEEIGREEFLRVLNQL